MSPERARTAHVAPNSLVRGMAVAGTRLAFRGTMPSGVTVPMYPRTTFLGHFDPGTRLDVTRWM